MTNIEKIIFDSKFTVRYLNGLYAISGFDHVKTLHVEEKEIKDVLDVIYLFNQSEWEDYILDYK